jgi:putative amidoligase enzyme
MTEPIPIDDLTFGVELEVILPRARAGDRDGLAAALAAAGLDAAHEGYNHRVRPNWKVVTDGSIGHDNAEVVSPILRGPDGFRQVRLACAALETFGCRVNRSTGFHVHVGVADRFGEQIGFFKELVRTYAKFEPVLDQLVAPSRRARNNNWCAPVAYTPEIERARTINALRSAYGGNRYRKLNLEAFAVHGTVEFRQHQGTTSPSKIENWVRLCLRMVAHAARNTERATADPGRPPSRPWLPPEPTFVDPPDLTDAPRVPADRIVARNVRFHGRQWVIGRIIAGTNPRRPGTAGHANWPLYQVGQTVSAYRRAGGGLSHLRGDILYGNLVVVNAAGARTVSPTPGSDEDERRAAARDAWRRECDALTAAYERQLAAYEARVTADPAAAATRPPTDTAPTTLEGLLELIGAADPERAFFVERQLELNP